MLKSQELEKIIKKFNEKIQKERISAFKEFKKDTEDRNFNDPKLTVDID